MENGENGNKIYQILANNDSRYHYHNIDEDYFKGSLPHITVDSLFLVPEMTGLQACPESFKDHGYYFSSIITSISFLIPANLALSILAPTVSITLPAIREPIIPQVSRFSSFAKPYRNPAA